MDLTIVQQEQLRGYFKATLSDLIFGEDWDGFVNDLGSRARERDAYELEFVTAMLVERVVRRRSYEPERWEQGDAKGVTAAGLGVALKRQGDACLCGSGFEALALERHGVREEYLRLGAGAYKAAGLLLGGHRETVYQSVGERFRVWSERLWRFRCTIERGHEGVERYHGELLDVSQSFLELPPGMVLLPPEEA